MDVWRPSGVSGVSVVGRFTAVVQSTALEADLLRERNLFNQLLQHLQTAVIVCDAQGKILIHNELLNKHKFAIPPMTPLEEWLPKVTAFTDDGVTPLDVHQTPIPRALRGERVEDLRFAIQVAPNEMRFRRAWGGPMFDASGAMVGAVFAIHDVTDQRRVETALLAQATHDSLTGLPNRSVVQERLQAALARSRRSKTPVAVLFIDLDHFKLVNDTIDHAAGDRLLVAVAQQVRAVIRPADTLVRLGGDEFLAICENLSGVGDALTVADRIRAAVTHAVQTLGIEIPVSASIGIAMAQTGLESPDSLLTDADTAMYRAKEAGRDGVEVFGEELRAKALARIEGQRGLIAAIEEQRIRTHFQPIYDAASGRMVGAEALARIIDPVVGIVEAGSFLDVAEETGLVTQLDDIVMRQALAFLAERRAEGNLDLFVGINLSLRTLGRADVVSWLADAAEAAGVPMSRIGLEISESRILTAPALLHGTIEALAERDVHVGLDHFGSGNSSLAFARQWPLSFVKIDRLYVADIGTNPQSAAIVDSLIRLAHALRQSVTAQGVETAEQAAVLRSLGCDFLQGFYLSEPVAAGDWETDQSQA
jgi:diguanylate cyclase (GGDEF)-like protein